LAVGSNPAAVALVAHHGDLATIAAEVVEEGGQMVSHGRTLERIQFLRCGIAVFVLD
jgi:hypothetical protein